jgi:hypothetical protein
MQDPGLEPEPSSKSDPEPKKKSFRIHNKRVLIYRWRASINDKGSLVMLLYATSLF